MGSGVLANNDESTVVDTTELFALVVSRDRLELNCEIRGISISRNNTLFLSY
jgi:hypothetical protein